MRNTRQGTQDLKGKRSQPYNKSWRPWELSSRRMKNIDVSKSEFGKKPGPSKKNCEQRPKPTKIVFGRKHDWIKRVLWRKSRSPEGLWKNMHKPMRKCVKPTRNCGGTCTAMADAPLENVPRTYAWEMTPNRSINKHGRAHTASLYHAQDCPFLRRGGSLQSLEGVQSSNDHLGRGVRCRPL